ncbi:MAG: PorT family protein [Bacteroidetes bacterium]|nr:PorT family protein [Bacteroidota bacterium]
MKRLFFILTSSTIYLTASGQHDIGLTANGGLSYLSTKLTSSQTTQKFYFVPSGHGGLFYNFHLGDKSLLGTELLFIQIEGKERSQIPVTDQYGNPTGQFIVQDIRRHISYFGIPIYYGYKIKKLTINLGFQILFTLTSSGHSEYQSPIPIIILPPISDKLNIDSYDYGARTALTYNLTNKFSIETTYYYGLHNIFKGSPDWWIWKTQEVTVGLRYKLFSLGGQKSETEK